MDWVSIQLKTPNSFQNDTWGIVFVRPPVQIFSWWIEPLSALITCQFFASFFSCISFIFINNVISFLRHGLRPHAVARLQTKAVCVVVHANEEVAEKSRSRALLWWMRQIYVPVIIKTNCGAKNHFPCLGFCHKIDCAYACNTHPRNLFSPKDTSCLH